MALKEYVGAIVMEIDGREVECVSLSPQKNTGRKLVKVMKRASGAGGFVRGVTQFDLTVTVVIPADGDDIDWSAIEGAKITREPIAGGKRKSYLDCFSTDVGEEFSVDGGEARRTIRMHALREVDE